MPARLWTTRSTRPFEAHLPHRAMRTCWVVKSMAGSRSARSRPSRLEARLPHTEPGEAVLVGGGWRGGGRVPGLAGSGRPVGGRGRERHRVHPFREGRRHEDEARLHSSRTIRLVYRVYASIGVDCVWVVTLRLV